jgi:phenylacetate-CoA ligase
VKSLGDLKNLPLTDKDDLDLENPQELLAVPSDGILRFHASSGTKGSITVTGFTKGDIDAWARLVARSFAAASVTADDVINVGFYYGLFTGGLGFHYGAEAMGATVIPSSGGSSRRQISLMRRLKATAICCTPSFALYLSEVAKEDGLDFRDKSVFPLRIGVLGAEPWSATLRDSIEKRLGITALDVYGLSEIMGPGVSAECIEGRRGLHIFEDHFIPEIIDPKTGEVLPAGREGELVLTTLTREGTPLIRYRTRDITSIFEESCPCGRTYRRMAKVMGRSDEMIIVRGINIFPCKFEEFILKFKALSPNYQIQIDRERELDTLEIQVEPNPDYLLPLDEDDLKKSLVTVIKEQLGITARVRLVPPKTVERGQLKTQRVFDMRHLKN